MKLREKGRKKRENKTGEFCRNLFCLLSSLFSYLFLLTDINPVDKHDKNLKKTLRYG
jgi:hypothetical protein